MEEIRNEEQKSCFVTLTDQFSFSVFFVPKLGFIQIEDVEAFCEKPNDDEVLAYINGHYEIRLGFRQKGSNKPRLKVFRRTFCFLPDTSFRCSFEHGVLDCEAKAEAVISRLWSFNIIGGFALIPWKVTVKVKIKFSREEMEKKQELISLPFEKDMEKTLLEDLTVEDKLQRNNDVEPDKETDLTLSENGDQLSVGLNADLKEDKNELYLEKEDLIALEQKNNKNQVEKRVFPQYRKKRYKYYDLIMQQWENEMKVKMKKINGK